MSKDKHKHKHGMIMVISIGSKPKKKTGVMKGPEASHNASPAGDGPFPLDPKLCWTCRGTGMVGPGKKCPHHD